MNDKEVVLKIKNGEIDFFYLIVKKYTSLIYQYIKKRIFDTEAVNDLVQNSFINLYKAINRFDEKRPILPYLYQIAKNEMKMYFRSHKQMFPLDERMQISEQDEVFFNKDYDQILITLPKEQKKALELLIEGYSYKEISERMSKPINTVRTIIRRARLKIKKTNENY